MRAKKRSNALKSYTPGDFHAAFSPRMGVNIEYAGVPVSRGCFQNLITQSKERICFPAVDEEPGAARVQI